MDSIGVGLVGTGFMGKAHALAWSAARPVLGGVMAGLPKVRLETLADTPADQAARMADQFGFARATDDWRAMLDDPCIDVISITTPNQMHAAMAVAALQAGKHVWCEKPMALTLEEARAMTAAAEASGRHTMVGYNYTRNPAHRHAIRLIGEGAVGRVVQFRGWVEEDYQADPDLPWTWRARIADAGLGALGDLGCHLVSLALDVMGPMESLVADMQTIHQTRPLPDGSGHGTVENEDAASALVRFANGAQGTMAVSRAAWGRKSRLGYEVHGTEGMIVFDQERMNELQLYQNRGEKAEQGFRTILTGPAHPPYGAFCPAPGHQLGFNDLKVIECAEFLKAIVGGTRADLDFAAALRIEEIIHAMAMSAREDRRVNV